MRKFRVTIIVENVSEYELGLSANEQSAYFFISSPKNTLPHQAEQMLLSIGDRTQRDYIIEHRRGDALAPWMKELLLY